MLEQNRMQWQMGTGNMPRGHQNVRLIECSDMPPGRSLTRREREVLELVAQGLANRQVAEQLGISVGTVKWHLVRIYRKLNVCNRMKAVLRAQALKRLS